LHDDKEKANAEPIAHSKIENWKQVQIYFYYDQYQHSRGNVRLLRSQKLEPGSEHDDRNSKIIASYFRRYYLYPDLRRRLLRKKETRNLFSIKQITH